MYTERIKEFIDKQVHVIKESIKTLGGFQATFYIFSRNAEGAFGVVVAPVPFELMEAPREILLDYLKVVKGELRKRQFEILCINWASEGWAYHPPKGWTPESNIDYRQFPKKEVLILNFSHEDGNETYAYNILRPDGVSVNMLGELVDQVELEEVAGGDKPSEASGIMSNLYAI